MMLYGGVIAEFMNSFDIRTPWFYLATHESALLDLQGPNFLVKHASVTPHEKGNLTSLTIQKDASCQS